MKNIEHIVNNQKKVFNYGYLITYDDVMIMIIKYFVINQKFKLYKSC